MTDYDEKFDTQFDVEQNPCGAWQAIQELTAERDRYKARAERAEEALYRIQDMSYGKNAAIARATLAQIDAEPAEPRQPTVKPLEWHKSRVFGWNDDWHTVPTAYTIRCADENGWKWSTPLGAFGYEPSPNSAKATAQADYERRILNAIEYRQPTVQEAARVLLGGFESPMLVALDPFNNSVDVAEDVLAALRALAEGDNQ